MKSKLAMVSVAAVLLVGASTFLAAETIKPFIQANVPFEFRVGSQVMPAGQYQIVHYDTVASLLVRSVERKTAILVISSASGTNTGVVARLVFHRYGDTYFLRQVWIPGTNANELSQSKAEVEYARRGNGPEHTTVLAFVGR